MRDHFLIHHVVSGTGAYTMSGKTHRLCAGDTFIAYPGSMIAYSADKLDPWEYCWVGFNGSDARFLLEQTPFSHTNPVISEGNCGQLKKLLLDIYHCHGNRAFESARMTGCLYIFLSHLMALAPESKPPEKSLHYVRIAAEFVSDNYSRPIGVADMAHFAGVSRSWLYRLFMQHLNISPAAYLTQFRIEQATLLLLNSSLSVSETAYSVGFEDPFYFSKLFKRHTGFSPKQYSKLHRKVN